MPLRKDDVRRISWGNGNGTGKKETVWGSGQILVIIIIGTAYSALIMDCYWTDYHVSAPTPLLLQ
jgi:hypothetical protein